MDQIKQICLKTNKQTATPMLIFQTFLSLSYRVKKMAERVVK